MPILLHMRTGIVYPALWADRSEWFRRYDGDMEGLADVLDSVGSEAINDMGGWRGILVGAQWREGEQTQPTLREVVKHHILHVLREHDGNMARAAKALGVNATTIWRHKTNMKRRTSTMRSFTVIAGILGLLALPLVAHAQIATRTFSWTATGDDSLTGTATSYTMKWSRTRPDTTSAATKATWWSAATAFSGMPVPLIAGTRQSATVGPTGGFAVGTYYVVIRVSDEVPNISEWSNVVTLVITDIVPPAKITDLEVAP